MDFDLIQPNIKQEPPIEFDCDFRSEEYQSDDDFNYIQTQEEPELEENAVDFGLPASPLSGTRTSRSPPQDRSGLFSPSGHRILSTINHDTLLVLQKDPSLSQQNSTFSLQENTKKCISFECVICGMDFKKWQQLKMHANIHQLPTKSLKAMKATPSKFKCKECDKKFSRLKYLRKHESTHKSFECIICGWIFIRLSRLEMHLKEHEDFVLKPNRIPSPSSPSTIDKCLPTKQFPCKICGQQYSSYYYWRKHIIQTHLKAKKSCVECSKMFKRSDHLKEHQRTHIIGIHITDVVDDTTNNNNKLSLKCKFCDITSTSRTAHNRHIRLHMEHGVENPLLSDHTLVLKKAKPLKPYTCMHCGQQFLRKYSWRRHTDAHEMPRRYECDMCGNRYNRPSHLKEHQLVHTRVCPYKCVICGSSMNHKSTLTKHMKTHSEYTTSKWSFKGTQITN